MEQTEKSILTSGDMASALKLSLDAFDRLLQRYKEVLPPVRGRAGIIRYWFQNDLPTFQQVLESDRRSKKFS